MRRLALILGLCLALAPALRAGEVGSTLGRYSVAGAGVGALLGTVGGTLPFLQSQQPYDFLVGAGAGMLAGAGVGLILGIIDLANPAETALAPHEGFQMAFSPQAVQAGYTLRF